MRLPMKKYLLTGTMLCALCMGFKMPACATVNVEEKAEEAKEMYNELEDDLSLREESAENGIRYFFDDNDKIRIIVVPPETEYNMDGSFVTDYESGYYYDEDEHLFFTFLSNGAENYRYYLTPTEESNCAIYRYIDPEGNVYDYPEGIAAVDYEQVGPEAIYCRFGEREMTWAQEARYDE